MPMNIVLLEPEIPANTGNIGRTCVATGSRLHLIEPLGFHLSERNLKRAGMDYWDQLDVTRYSNYEDFLKRNPTWVYWKGRALKALGERHDANALFKSIEKV